MADLEKTPASATIQMNPSPSSPRSSDDGSPVAESQKPPAALDWDGPDDELNPHNWSSTARWFGTLMPGIFCFVVTLSSSIVSTPSLGSIRLEADSDGISTQARFDFALMTMFHQTDIGCFSWRLRDKSKIPCIHGGGAARSLALCLGFRIGVSCLLSHPYGY